MDRARRILLVDDDPEPLTTLIEALVFEGYRVTVARSGPEALARIATRSIDLVITDYRMSPMNGLELTRKIHCYAPRLPILILTGELSTDLPTAARAAGALAVLSKPFRLEDLLRLVSQICQGPSSW
ncbi:MAG: response regulator [Candidatus Methylomirabilales bacterium]